MFFYKLRGLFFSLQKAKKKEAGVSHCLFCAPWHFKLLYMLEPRMSLGFGWQAAIFCCTYHLCSHLWDVYLMKGTLSLEQQVTTDPPCERQAPDEAAPASRKLIQHWDWAATVRGFSVREATLMAAWETSPLAAGQMLYFSFFLSVACNTRLSDQPAWGQVRW